VKYLGVSMGRRYKNMMIHFLHIIIQFSFLNLGREPLLNFSEWEIEIMRRVFNVMSIPHPQLM